MSDTSQTYRGILPLVLAREIRDGIQEFLHTSFRPSTPGLENLITNFTKDSDNLFRGPYLGLDLPFVPDSDNTEIFPDVPLGYIPYSHQQRAFIRLQGSERQSTLVATGTGSGKTECFLLPILDWCRQHAGEPGIKAIVIYPMNALAEDQAKRLAARIWANPRLRGRVRAGMYADQEPPNPTTGMQPDDLIRSRSVMHSQPPDILLTNYKMLDNLLIRPDRKQLWAQNQPETLRYLVVDELHTFDGAQGTDLAYLIRRLKAYLQVPAQSLCCVGTSATLGTDSTAGSLLSYARDLFDEEFSPDAVVTEERISMADFLKQVQSDEELSDACPSAETAARLAARAHTLEPGDLVQAWYRAWFGESPPGDLTGNAGRAQLGHRISHHTFLAHLLVALDGRVQSLAALARRMQHLMGTQEPLHYITNLLEGFVTLIAFARRPVGNQDYLPYLTVRIHFWIRELNRMVVSLPVSDHAGKPASTQDASNLPARLWHSQELAAEHPEAVLPVVHCRECGGVVWITQETAQGDGFDPDLDAIYTAYFTFQASSRLYYLLSQPPAPGVMARERYAQGYICRQCLRWHTQPDPPAQCQACGSPEVTRMWHSQPQWTVTGTGRQMQRSARCAYCGSSTGTGIFGVSGTSLASALVSLLFASKANGDPKLLAFGDSVQEVAHKAGFIEARSYRTLLRQTVAHWISGQPGAVSLDYLHAQLAADIRQTYANAAEFAGAMTHVDLMWRANLRDLFEGESDQDALPADMAASQIPDLHPSDLQAVNRRLEWETFSELTFRSQFGRTLENTGCLTLALDKAVLWHVARDMKAEAGERLGTLFATPTTEEFLHFLLGVLYRMLHDGAVRIDPRDIDPVGTLARERANWFAVIRSRQGASDYPRYGRQARKPLLPSLQAKEGFAGLTDAGSSARWYPVWARKSLSGGETLRRDLLTDFYALTFALLTKHGLAESVEGQKQAAVWVIPANRVTVSAASVRLTCSHCQRRTHVRPNHVDLWQGMQCLNPGCPSGRLEVDPADASASILRDHLLHGRLRRVNARDHTSLLETERRRRIEQQFMAGRHSWYPNLLSTTPTLELGVDIGDLSSVLLYAVPPAQANYVQRLGRAGRREGNALGLTIVNAQPHDLFFWTDPLEMIQGAVTTPGLYLQAHAILRRQFCAYTLERLITDTGQSARFGTVKNALTAVARKDDDLFPLNWIRFVEQQGAALLRDFQAVFALSDQQELKKRLADFVNTEAAFRTAVLDELHSAETHHKLWQNRIRKLAREIRRLRDTQPRPADWDKQVRRLERDRRVYGAISRDMNRQDVLELLTDGGILPNYAFPEEGVRLRSVISTQDAKGQWHLKRYDYVRSASAGLTELVPGANFYAEGHRVPVNAVDLRISEPEAWRFCPDCPYMARESGSPALACPRCGSRYWRDQGQLHKMVRLKQVHAESTARQSRIADDQERRTLVRYTREIYPAFDAQEARDAHLMRVLPQPFGFEFLPRVEFQDVNFGRRGEEILLKAAGRGVLAESFLLCEQCGHALSAPKASGQGPLWSTGQTDQAAWKEEHAHHCPVRRATTDASYRIETFLYHAFRSEAVRIRLPIRNADEIQIASFTAALHLGLRLAFRGQVEHLQSFMLSLDQGSTKVHWLFLYDSVPGGTGYLEQLVRPDVFHEVLQRALQTMQECTCNQDQDEDAELHRDGCYRCLLGYRHRTRMPVISRDTAIRMLREILGHWSSLEAASSLEQVDAAQVEESELELRFVAWLQREVQVAGGQFRSAPVRPGKNGYVIRMAGVIWEIEPQVSLGSGDSVVVPSRADFVFRQIKGGSQLSRPIAVFTDGWAYHQDRIALDIRQRMAIRDSGKFWIWSLTWNDLKDEPASAQTGWNPLSALKTDGLPFRHEDARTLLPDVQRHGSAKLLLHYLRAPTARIWTAVAGLLSLQVLVQHRMQSEEWLECMDETHAVASDYANDMPLRSHFGLTRCQATFLAIGIAQSDLSPTMNESGLHTFLYLDVDPEDTEQRYCQWAGALHLYNILQFLPRTYWLCSTETDPPFPRMWVPAVSDPDGWEESMQYLDAKVRGLAMDLRAAGVPVPEVGWELMQAGRVVAEVELAWPDLRVGVLLEAVPDALHQQLVQDGWTLVQVDKGETDAADLITVLHRESEA